jgi:hypothetical protein
MISVSTARLGPSSAFFGLLSFSGDFHGQLLQAMFEGGNVGIGFEGGR